MEKHVFSILLNIHKMSVPQVSVPIYLFNMKNHVRLYASKFRTGFPLQKLCGIQLSDNLIIKVYLLLPASFYRRD